MTEREDEWALNEWEADGSLPIVVRRVACRFLATRLAQTRNNHPASNRRGRNSNIPDEPRERDLPSKILCLAKVQSKTIGSHSSAKTQEHSRLSDTHSKIRNTARKAGDARRNDDFRKYWLINYYWPLKCCFGGKELRNLSLCVCARTRTHTRTHARLI